MIKNDSLIIRILFIFFYYQNTIAEEMSEAEVNHQNATLGEHVEGEVEVAEKMDETEEESRKEEKIEESLGQGENDSGMQEDEEEFKGERKTIVIAHFEMSNLIWKDEDLQVFWFGFPDLNINAMTVQMKKILQSEEPLNIILLAYQKFITINDVTTIEKHLNEIASMAMDSIHKLGISCVWYVPQEERVWETNTQLNHHIRLLNLNMDMAPCNVHKNLLFSVKNGKIHYVRPTCWKEYVERTGVGKNLSLAGLTRVKESVLMYANKAFTGEPRPASKPISGDIEPPPLFLTQGYKGDKQMLEFIKKSGLRQASRQGLGLGVKNNQGQTSTRSFSARGHPRNRSVSARGRPMGPPKDPPFRGRSETVKSQRPEARDTRSESKKDDKIEVPKKRNKENEAPKKTNELPRKRSEEDRRAESEKIDDSDDDMTEEEKRTKYYLEEKGRRQPDLEDLSEQLEDMRIKGLQLSKRNREKFEGLERRIKELKDEIYEKDKKIKDQRERLRDYRESETKIRNLNDKLRDKNDRIRTLEGQLARADVDNDEWRKAYERMSEDSWGQKRRRK